MQYKNLKTRLIGKNIIFYEVIDSTQLEILRKIENIKFRYEREKFCQYNVAINELEFKNDKFKIIRLADINYLNK